MTGLAITREELEAAIWEALDVLNGQPRSLWFVDRMLELADAYAAGDSEQLTAMRRAVLARGRGIIRESQQPV